MRMSRWVMLALIAGGIIAIAGVAATMLKRSTRIDQPELAMTDLLKEFKLSVSLHPTDAKGLSASDGYDWYLGSLSAGECDNLIEAMRARVDGKVVSVSKQRAPVGGKPPAWWGPQASADLLAFDVEEPALWVGIAKGQGKMYLRRMR